MKQHGKTPAWSRAVVACGLMLGLLLQGPPLIAAEVSEVAVKAAYLYRFAAFVEWPAGVMEKAPFTIALIGADDVAEELGKLVPDLVVHGLEVEMVRARRRADLANAHMVYVGRGAMPVASPMLDALPGRPLLVVSDNERELGNGAVINFVRVGPNVRFEVSLPAADRRQLRIGSGLLSVAARVEGRRGADASCGKGWGASVPRFGCAGTQRWARLPGTATLSIAG